MTMCDNGIVCRQPENDTIHLESSMQWPFLCTLSDGRTHGVVGNRNCIEYWGNDQRRASIGCHYGLLLKSWSVRVIYTCPFGQRMTQSVWRAVGSDKLCALYLMEFPSTYPCMAMVLLVIEIVCIEYWGNDHVSFRIIVISNGSHLQKKSIPKEWENCPEFQKFSRSIFSPSRSEQFSKKKYQVHIAHQDCPL